MKGGPLEVTFSVGVGSFSVVPQTARTLSSFIKESNEYAVAVRNMVARNLQNTHECSAP